MTKPKRPYGTNAKRRSVTVNDENWQALKAVGHGNASAGIRRLLREVDGLGESERGVNGIGSSGR